MKKIVISTVVTLMLMLIMSFSAYAISGSGTEARPYLISSASDIAKMHDDLDAHYKITADIDMSGIAFEPIGNEYEGVFSGTIDGAGHTIKNLDLNLSDNKYVGFVGYLEGTVKNLRLENVEACGYRYVGGIVGYAEENSVVSDCFVSGKVQAVAQISDAYAGGIVGYADNCSVDYCENMAEVSCTESEYRLFAGGIVACNKKGTISDCTNSGNVSSSGKYSYAGGIAGYNDYGEISNCTNSGSVSASSSSSSSSFAGGIAGYNYGGEISNCTNNGSVSASSSSYAGGIVGLNGGTISNCTNSGSVSASSSSSSSSYAGGIVGRNDGTISDCTNSGSVSASSSSYTSSYAGGIAGYNDYGEISNCTNSGSISASSSSSYPSSNYAGGIAGTNSGTISNCTNIGSISSSSSSNYAGGIVGTNSGTISNCTNSGDVTSSYYAGGIAGYNYDGEISNCTNNGDVTSSSSYYRAGGIAGDNTGTINNCYSLRGVTNSNYTLDFENFKKEESFVGFDFENIWYIDPDTNSGFPQLRNMPEHIELNECVIFMEMGDTDRLYAYIDGISEDVTWASDDATVATVSSNGTVTAEAIGVCTVTATNAEGMKANCTVIVYGRASTFTLSNDEISINRYSTYSLTGVQTPSTANEILYWYSDNKEVATVDEDGVVKGISKGTTTIYAQTAHSGLVASCVVNVFAPITSINLSATSANIAIGESYTLSASPVPEKHDGSISWSSADETIATVDNNGKITAHSFGTVYITATATSGATAQCKVTVVQPSTEIKLNKNQITTYVGSTYQLSYILSPEDSTDTVTWTSSSTSYATVSSTGLVTGQRVGTATITARTTSGLVATCNVNVKAAPVLPTALTLSDTYITLAPQDAKALTATFTPSNSTEKSLTWISSNEAVAVVDKNGVVTANAEGFATITAQTVNGISHECVVKVVSASGPSVMLGNAKASPGGTAKVKADIVKNPGISAYKFTVNYDDTVMTPVSVTANKELGGTLTTNLDDAERTEFNILWYSDNETDVSINGELFEIAFAISENAQYGATSEVSLSYGAKDICNVKGENIALYTDTATVSVAEVLPGDVCEDDDVNVYDLTLLARYITGLEVFTERQISAGDVNDDGEIDIKDVVILAQYIVGWTGVELLETEEKTADIRIGGVSVSENMVAEIPVYIENNSGIAGFRYKISYNADALEIIEIVPNTELLSDSFRTNLGSEGDNGLIVTWYQEDNMVDNGVMFTIKARLKGDEQAGRISVVPAENNMCDSATSDVIGTYASGLAFSQSICIDINRDGFADFEDVSVLMKAYAGAIEDSSALDTDVDKDAKFTLLDLRKLVKIMADNS